jgi:hypothetical protein
LMPFAHAGIRVADYDGNSLDDCPIMAEKDNNCWELLFNDGDTVPAELLTGEDCRQLVVQDLKVAVLAIQGKKGE